MSRIALLSVLVIVGLSPCFGARILGVFPTPIRSHFIFASALLRGLAEKGHHVTVLSCFPPEGSLENYRHIQIATESSSDRGIYEKFSTDGWSYFGTLRLLINALRDTLQTANRTLHSSEFKQIAQEEFDLIFVEMFLNTFLIGLGDHFKCPVVMIFSAPSSEFINHLSGNPSTVATLPHFLLGKSQEMTFIMRFLNFGFTTVERTVWSVIDWRERIYYEENFSSPKYRSYEEMKKNVSLYFVNDHFSITLPRAYLPSVIPVGGLNINSNPDALPKDIKQFLDGAEHGAILLSLGSCFKASFLPQKTIDIFIKVFSKLRQRILFKWEQDTLPNKPENVMISKWLPQADVLGHRNIKLFITHGGIGALNEAKYNGVPIIGTPFFADQKTNLASAEREGWAVVLDIKDLTEELLITAIDRVLNDSKYRNEIQRMSSLFRDRPMSALETAVYWTEYVIRHKGANHLKSSLIHLNWFQRNSLDVLLAYMVLFYILMTFISYLRHLRRMRRRSLGNKLKNEKSKNE